MVEGIIMKAIAGFYYVDIGEKIIECRARGIFKKRKISPLVGDKVSISIDAINTTKGRIEEVFKRSVELVRPPVANVTQAIIVFAIKDPNPNINLLDKLLAICEYRGVNAIICFNKIDLDKENKYKKMENIYKLAGYNVVSTSIEISKSVEVLKDILNNEISVFAGPSGVGKSSLLNELQEGLKLKVGELSKKIARGKHTTRHSELIKLDSGGMVVDTPGFTSLDIIDIELDDLSDCFIEFRRFSDGCKFNDCKHLNEPGCNVKLAIENGEISESRYESYIYFMDKLEEHRRYKSW